MDASAKTTNGDRAVLEAYRARLLRELDGLNKLLEEGEPITARALAATPALR